MLEKGRGEAVFVWEMIMEFSFVEELVSWHQSRLQGWLVQALLS